MTSAAPARIAFEEFLCSWTPQVAQWPLARYRNTSTLGVAPDGALFHISNEDGQQDLWRQDPTGARRRLTDLGERVARWFVVEPSGSVILAADRHGDEDHQLYRVTADGRMSDLVVREGVQHHLRARSLSRDGRHLAYSANLRERSDVEVVVRDLRTGEERVVLGGDAWHVVGDWSPDARHLLASRVQDNTDQDLILVDVRGGDATHLTPHEGEEKNFPVGFDREGRGVYFLTDRGGEFLWLARLDLATRDVSVVAKEPWDVLSARLDRDANTLVWAVNEDGAFRFAGRDLRTGGALAMPPLPRGYANDFVLSPEGDRVVVQWSSTAGPWRILAADPRRGAWRSAVRTTLRRDGELADDVPIRIAGPEGEIPAMLLRPRRNGRIPLVLHVHGGPEGQEHPMYLAFRQYLVANGVAVLVPNIHGSTGYGSSYQRAIHRDWGGVDLRDLDALARWATAQEWVDAQRLGIYGGSYGGFATLSAITRLPQYWRVAVEAFGPADLQTFVKRNSPSWQRFLRRWVGDPVRDAERLRKTSPITYAANLRCPLLVIQGAADPRVPRGESDQLTERLRELGKDVTYIAQERTGHGWTKRDAYAEAYGMIGTFLLRHLLD